ncbi:hypothetical protein SDC9_194572 [bioreactor metagenome]|uniref:Uncharacterized protein n=1 Tax=bioreactor metagenome TaxID=1076179 RepID=A0A645II02_9ZZZZ
MNILRIGRRNHNVALTATTVIRNPLKYAPMFKRANVIKLIIDLLQFHSAKLNFTSEGRNFSDFFLGQLNGCLLIYDANLRQIYRLNV